MLHGTTTHNISSGHVLLTICMTALDLALTLGRQYMKGIGGLAEYHHMCAPKCHIDFDMDKAILFALNETKFSSTFEAASHPEWQGSGLHRRDHVTFNFNMKAGVTSMQKYIACEFANQSAYNLVNAMIVRDPISRFVSGVAELLNRYLNGGNIYTIYCRDAHCDEFRRMLSLLAPGTYWMQLLPKLDLNSEADLSRLLEAFYMDLQCCNRYSDDVHLYPQIAFARPFDVLIYLDDRLDAGLDDLAMLAGKEQRKCTFPHENKHTKDVFHGSNKAPTSAALMLALEKSDNLLKSLCAYFSVDFIFFDLPMPTACR